MQLNQLKPGIGSRKKRKRLGRGDASGHGGTSTKGHKGQKARSGGYHKRGFEGGQMPLVRRLPKRGFTNIFATDFAVLNLDRLKDWPAKEPVTTAALLARGMVRKSKDGVKLLGRGDAAQAFTVNVEQISADARRKVEAAGGKVELRTAAKAA